MKFKQRAFRMRAFNQETLEKLAARLTEGYNELLLNDICKIMSLWKIELMKTIKLNQDKD